MSVVKFAGIKISGKPVSCAHVVLRISDRVFAHFEPVFPAPACKHDGAVDMKHESMITHCRCCKCGMTWKTMTQ